MDDYQKEHLKLLKEQNEKLEVQNQLIAKTCTNIYHSSIAIIVGIFFTAMIFG